MKRAITREQKREILDRLFVVWTREKNEQLRLGQLIHIALLCHLNKSIKRSDVLDCSFFYIEDDELIQALESE